MLANKLWYSEIKKVIWIFFPSDKWFHVNFHLSFSILVQKYLSFFKTSKILHLKIHNNVILSIKISNNWKLSWRSLSLCPSFFLKHLSHCAPCPDSFFWLNFWIFIWNPLWKLQYLVSWDSAVQSLQYFTCKL